MISIIIVGFNSQKYLKECLESVFTSSYKKFRVLFVDNNSDDDSVDYIKKNFPQVVLIESKKNLGFAGGNNLGIKRALKLNSEYILLLNPDTIVDKDCLNLLIKKIDKNTILQPLILLHENGQKTDLINTTGNYLNFLGISYCNNYRQPSSFAKEEDIATASGAAAMIPAVAIEKIGMLDDSFFMYYEDVDLFWRTRVAGFNIRLIPEARIWHKYNFSRNNDKFFLIERNRLLFLYKNFYLKYFIFIFPAFLLNEILIILFAAKNGWLKMKLKSYISVLKLLPGKLGKEGATAKRAALTNHSLKDYLSAPIFFQEIASPLFLPYNFLLTIYWRIIKPLV